MIRDFLLPDLGEGLPEAEIVSWLVDEGDEVTLNQTIAEVETAKAVVELPSPYAGTIATRHAEAGDVVAVGSVLVSFEVADAERPGQPAAPSGADAATAAPEPAPSREESPAPAPRREPNLVGYGAAPRSGDRPQRRPRRAAPAPRRGAPDVAVLAAAPHDAVHAHVDVEQPLERPRSTPPVRKLAKDLGVDLALVEATGLSGLITRADVQAYADRTAAPAAADAAPAASPPPLAGDRITRTTVRGVRRRTADAMVASAFTAPHVTTFLTVDATATIELVESLRADRSLTGTRIGILAVVAKACCLALPRSPMLNARWDDEAGEIVTHHFVNLGIAAATERGLVVPNIKDADAMTLPELADAIGALADTARAGRSTPADFAGGTFTITNVGVFGVDAGTPILNPGEAGILALGAVRRVPWEHRGEIALRDVVTLSLSFDHRLVDGAEGARFLADVGAVLREPGRAMLLR